MSGALELRHSLFLALRAGYTKLQNTQEKKICFQSVKEALRCGIRGNRSMCTVRIHTKVLTGDERDGVHDV